VGEVIEFLRNRPENVNIVITGYDAPPPLIEFADLVTEMQLVKHPYYENVQALPGIDF
jgi:ATP:corrinoid adenosyltransferase